jgi:predicted short-subunit dehydrogenase-like oxidoreductase (DUF2520 family)
VRFIGAGKPRGSLSRAALASQLILITTPDTAIRSVADELARIGAEELQRKVVLHTSGALDSTVLNPVREFGAAVGSMHPLQTFTGVGTPPLDGRIFAIEGDQPAVRIARKIARSVGGLPLQIDPKNKSLYHAAGALAAGHALVLMEAATQILMSVGINRTRAVQALLSMTRQVLENYERFGARTSWTGPLSRHDYSVVAGHTEALNRVSPEHGDAYDAMNRLAARILTQNAEARGAMLRELSKKKQAKGKTMGSKE